MCLYPRLLPNPKYKPNKKNGGNVPELKDERVKWVPVGCQRCIECRKQKARGWSVRLQEEMRVRNHGQFVTLTFSNEHLKNIIEGRDIDGKIIDEPITEEGYELDNKVCQVAMRRFLERWRKKYKVSLRHWVVTEIGSGTTKKGHQGTENIHMHGIMWVKKESHIINRDTGEIIKTYGLKEQIQDIKDIWQYGFVYIGDYCNESTVNYTVKYVYKTDMLHQEYNPKIFTSAGIGNGYTKRQDAKLNSFKANGNTDERYTTRTGAKLNLPIYYRNKVYTEEQREKLWIEKLDKQERWICGTKCKIDTTQGIEGYYKLLEYHQARNKRLGYGGQPNWQRLEYENERRRIQQHRRIGRRDMEPLETERMERSGKRKATVATKRATGWLQEVLRRAQQEEQALNQKRARNALNNEGEDSPWASS